MPNNVTITIKEIRPSRRRSQAILAEIAVEITFAQHVITIDDTRILSGKRGPWIAMPSYAIQDGSKDYKYAPAVTLSPALQGEFEDTVLGAYKVWIKSSNSGTKNGTFTNMHNVNVSDDDIGF
jgi:DNA-binding cell septation regulator SpoVG